MSTSYLAAPARVHGKDDQRQIEDARESLAATLAWMTVSVALRPDTAPGTKAFTAPAESWRAPAGAMTPATGAPTEASSSDAKMVAEVETEAFGKIRLVVERTKSGLSIVLGVDEEASLAAVQAHRVGLEQALAAAGLPVASVVFTVLGADGTTFALERNGLSNALADPLDSAGTDEPRQRATGKRRLNTFG